MSISKDRVIGIFNRLISLLPSILCSKKSIISIGFVVFLVTFTQLFSLITGTFILGDAIIDIDSLDLNAISNNNDYSNEMTIINGTVVINETLIPKINLKDKKGKGVGNYKIIKQANNKFDITLTVEDETKDNNKNKKSDKGLIGSHVVSKKKIKKAEIKIKGLKGSKNNITSMIDDINSNSSVNTNIKSQVVAVDNIEEFDNAEIQLPIVDNSNINTIVRCDEFDFTNFECYGEWFATDIPFTIEDGLLIFEVDHFSGYGGAELEIINVQSYPFVGGNWTVMFNTTGTANLTITAINETTFGIGKPNDLEFLELKCGNNLLTTSLYNSTSIFYEDFECNETAYETSKVHTTGIHDLMFEFGNETEYAHNDAVACVDLTNSDSITANENISAVDANRFEVSGYVIICKADYTFSVGSGQHQFDITSSNFVLDCNGSTFTNSQASIFGNGVSFSGTGDNAVTVQNCEFNEFNRGISAVSGVLGTIIDQCNFTNGNAGIYFNNVDYTLINNSILFNNSNEGIYTTGGSTYNNITGNNISNNGNANGDYGIDFSGSTDDNNLIWDNYFSGNYDYHVRDNAGGNTYYMTPYSATNFFGGSKIGGNYWGGVDCVDHGLGPGPYHNTAGDGICDDFGYAITNDGDYIGDFDPYSINDKTSGCANITYPFTNTHYEWPLYVSGNATMCTSSYTSKPQSGEGVFYFNVTGVTLDCNGSIFDGSDGTDYGILISGSYDNVVAKNCVFTRYNTGLRGATASGFTVDGCTFKDGSNGIHFNNVDYTLINNSIIFNNSNEGIFTTSGSAFNNITGNNISNNGDANSDYGIDFSGTTDDNNLIWDNYFSGNYDYHVRDNAGGNTYYMTPYSATNFFGGSKIGGNYWEGVDCVDHGLGPAPYYNTAGDGICDDFGYAITNDGIYINDYDLYSINDKTSGCANITYPFTETHYEWPLYVTGNATMCTSSYTSKPQSGEGAIYFYDTNVDLDCNGSIFDGNDGTDYGILISGSYDNVVAKNCVFTRYNTGLRGATASGFTVDGCTFKDGTNGIHFNNVDYTLINNSILFNNSNEGIFTTGGSAFNNITGNNISDNGDANGDYGIDFSGTTDDNNLIWDNYFSGNYDYHVRDNAGGNTYYMTPYSATNFFGGSKIGGNYWGGVDCVDHGLGPGPYYNVAGDGICDDFGYTITNDGTPVYDYDLYSINDKTTGCANITYPFTQDHDARPLYVVGNATMCTISLQNNFSGASRGSVEFISHSQLDCNGSIFDGDNGSTDFGFYLPHTVDNVTIRNCTMQDYGSGLFLDGSSTSNKITDIKVYDSNFTSSSNMGMRLEFVYDSYFINNVIEKSTNENIYLDIDNHNNHFENNTVLNSFKHGIHLNNNNNDNNNFTGNNISNNGNAASEYGLYISNTQCENNIIWNNYFINTLNAKDEDGQNFWNFTKSLATNIIGGSQIGGNYWDNYTGVDTTGDTIGETTFAITSSTDNYPLTTLYTGCVNFSNTYSLNENITNVNGDYYIQGAVTLCNGTYSVTDADKDGALIFNISGESFDCNDSTIQGSGVGIGLLKNSVFSNISITNCNFKNYDIGLKFLTDSNVGNISMSDSSFDNVNHIYINNTEVNMTSFTISNNNGSIEFRSLNLTSSEYNTSGKVYLENNITGIDSTLLSDFDVSSILKFYEVSNVYPAGPIRDGATCDPSICTSVLFLGGNNHSFNVTGFTNYSLQEINIAPVINSVTLNETAYYGGSFQIVANVTDNNGQGDISTVNFTVTDPEGTVVINNLVGTQSGDLWYSNAFTVDQIGEYNYSALTFDSSALNDSTSISQFGFILVSAILTPSVVNTSDSLIVSGHINHTNGTDITNTDIEIYLNGTLQQFTADTGDGTDEALTVSTTDTIINDYTFLMGDEDSGDTSILVNDSTAFSAGDEILIIQIQNGTGTGVAGRYEFVDIASKSENTITLSSALNHSYGSGTFNATASSVTQIVRVPQYTTVTIDSEKGIAPLPWDGVKGGIVIFRATGIVNMTGNVSASYKGFRKGAGSKTRSTATAKGGDHGEGYLGYGDNALDNSPSNQDVETTSGSGGGGGLGRDGISGSAGGGGGHAFIGTDGYNTNFNSSGGEAVGNATLATIFFGGGGGGGGDDDSSGPSNGGAGGGIIIIFADQIINANVYSRGEYGYNVSNTAGTGGGGAGGTIYLIADDMTLGTVSAIGGQGGDVTASELGGDGSSGRIRLDYNSLTGTPIPAQDYNGTFILPTNTNSSADYSYNITALSVGGNFTVLVNITTNSLYGQSTQTLTIQAPPTTTINYPNNNNLSVNLNSINFNCSVLDADANLDSVTLYHNLNGGGSWIKDTNTSISGGSSTTLFSKVLTDSIGSKFRDATYKWNCFAEDNSGFNDWADTNNTFSSWDLGTFNDTIFNTTSNTLHLDVSGSGFKTVGTYLSRIYDAGYASWDDITWSNTTPDSSTLNITVRSCDDASCTGDAWNVTLTTPGVQSLSINNSRYFQYKADYKADGSSTPELFNITISYTSLDDFNPNVSTITPTSGYTTDSIVYTVDVSDDIGMSSCNLYSNGTNLGAMTISAGQASRSHTFTSAGAYSMVANCTDLAGKRNATSLTDVSITVDTTPPSTSVVSVGGDSSSPYSASGSSLAIIISGESSMSCRWSDSDLDYSSISSWRSCTIDGTQATCNVFSEGDEGGGGYGEYNCYDNIDNDYDLLIDCADSDCSGNSYCSETCTNSVDDDNDGYIDCADTECDGETGPGGITCNSGTEDTCNDGNDNDGDGNTDCADTDCDRSTGQSSTYCQPNGETLCADTKDNDGDGDIDCDDSSCSNSPTCGGGSGEGTSAVQCFNGVDDDTDGLIDCADSDCSYFDYCGGGSCDSTGYCGGQYVDWDDFESGLPEIISDADDLDYANDWTDIYQLRLRESSSYYAFAIEVEEASTLSVCSGTNNATYILYFDSDSSTGTGCTEGSYSGIDYKIEYDTQGSRIMYNCSDASFASSSSSYVESNPSFGCDYNLIYLGIDQAYLGNPSSTITIYVKTNESNGDAADALGPIYYTDGTIDFEFVDCYNTVDYDGDGNYDNTSSACTSVVSNGYDNVYEDCFNGVDDDSDGLSDSSDPDCYFLDDYTAPSSDNDAPEIDYSRVEELDDRAMVYFKTSERTNATIQFYNTNTTCESNYTIYNDSMVVPGLPDSYYSQHHKILVTDLSNSVNYTKYISCKDTHDVEQSTSQNLDILYTGTGTGSTYYYKIKICDENDNCALSSCGSFSTLDTFTNYNFQIDLPAGVDSYADWSGSGTYTAADIDSGVAQSSHYTDANLDFRLGGSRFIFAGASALENTSLDLSDADTFLNFSSGGNDFVGMDEDKWQNLMQNLAVNYVDLVLPVGAANLIYKCNSTGESCVDVTDKIVIVETNSTSSTVRIPTNLGFSVYYGVGGTNISAWDSTDSEEGSLIRYASDQVDFYANYSTGAGAITNSSTDYCEIKFNLTAGWSSYNNMTYNSTSTLYEYNRTFGETGTKQFNVSCISSSYDDLSVEDDFLINASVAAINLTAPTSGLFIIRGQDTTSLPHEDVFKLVSNYTTATARVYNSDNSSIGLSATCTFYMNSTLVGQNTTDSNGDCSLAFDHTSLTNGPYTFTANFTSQPAGFTPHASLNNATPSITLSNISTNLDGVNTRTGLTYKKGDAAVLDINITNNSIAQDPNSILVEVKATGSECQSVGGILFSHTYPGDIIKSSTGNYYSVSVLNTTDDIHWCVYANDTNQYITTASHSDRSVSDSDAVLNVSVTNSTDNPLINTTIEVYDAAGFTLQSTTINATNTDVSLNTVQGDSYRIKYSTVDLESTDISGISFSSADVSINPEFVEGYTGDLPSGATDVTNVIAVNDTTFTFSSANLSIKKNGMSITQIYHCTNWNSATDNCSSWDASSASSYSGFGQNATHFWFTVTDFSGYAGGNGSNTELTNYDQVDTEGGSILANAGNQIQFYANYTNATNNLEVESADCNITFNVTPLGPSSMTYNTSTRLYNYNRTFNTTGTIEWNATCAKANFDILTATDTVLLNDTTTPSVSTVTPTSAAEDIANNYTVNISDNVEVTGCDLYFDDVENGSMDISATQANRSITITTPGNYTMYANCTDAAGNRNTTSTTNITITDATNPTFTVNDAPTTGTTGETVLMNITGADNVGVAGINLTADNVSYEMNLSTGITYTYNFTVHSNSSADILYNMTVYDSAVNTNTTSIYTITVTDNDAPVVNLTGMPETHDLNATITLSCPNCSDNVGIANYLWQFNDSVNLTGANPERNFTEIASYNLTLYINDSAGLSDEDSYVFNVSDISGPYISSVTPASINEDTNTNFTVTVTDNIEVINCSFFSDNTRQGTMSYNNSTDIANYSMSFASSGSYTVYANCTDSSGNTNYTSTTLTVLRTATSSSGAAGAGGRIISIARQTVSDISEAIMALFISKQTEYHDLDIILEGIDSDAYLNISNINEFKLILNNTGNRTVYRLDASIESDSGEEILALSESFVYQILQGEAREIKLIPLVDLNNLSGKYIFNLLINSNNPKIYQGISFTLLLDNGQVMMSDVEVMDTTTTFDYNYYDRLTAVKAIIVVILLLTSLVVLFQAYVREHSKKENKLVDENEINKDNQSSLENKEDVALVGNKPKKPKRKRSRKHKKHNKLNKSKKKSIKHKKKPKTKKKSKKTAKKKTIKKKSKK